jgi:hypothetical protein
VSHTRLSSPVFEATEHWPLKPNIELTGAEAADLRRVQAEYAAWQSKLLAKLGEQ